MVESIFVEIISEENYTKSSIIGCIYPKQDTNEFTECFIYSLLDKLSTENKATLIIGDFNISLLNCDSYNNTSQFADTMHSHDFTSFISIPTRIVGHSKTLINNIFYDKPANNILAGNTCPIISDHLIQFLIEPKSSCKTTSNVKNKARCYRNFN